MDMERPDPHYRPEELEWLIDCINDGTRTRAVIAQAEHVAHVLKGYLVCLGGRSWLVRDRHSGEWVRAKSYDVQELIFRVTVGWWKCLRHSKDPKIKVAAERFYSDTPARAIQPLLGSYLPSKPENFAEPPRRGYYGWP